MRRYAIEIAILAAIAGILAFVVTRPAKADDLTKIMQTDGPRELFGPGPSISLWRVDWQDARCIVASKGSNSNVAISCDWEARK